MDSTPLIALAQLMYFMYNSRIAVIYSRNSRSAYADRGYEQHYQNLDPDEYPTISIMLPAYNERENVLRRNIGYIKRADYPSKKLDVLAVTEDGDGATRKTIERLQNDHPFLRSVIVPNNNDESWDEIWKIWEQKNVPWLNYGRDIPTMKPRALDYTLYKAVEGDITTIFDAEDIIDPTIFKRAAYVLANGADCAQGRLKFVNHADSLLSLQAVGDYAFWFGTRFYGMLRHVKKKRLPISLAGTSYFIKTDLLKELGGWDPTNMTEDAELGMRLYGYGHKVDLIDTDTFEEAPRKFFKTTTEGGWMNQRTRWARGFLKTVRDLKTMPYSRTDKLKMYYTLLFSPVFPLINLLGYPIMAYSALNKPDEIPLWLNTLSNVNSVWLGLFYYMSVRGLAETIGKDLKSTEEKIKTYGKYAATLLPYWVLQALPVVNAIKQEITEPIYWDKTDHLGLHHKTVEKLMEEATTDLKQTDRQQTNRKQELEEELLAV